MKIAQIVTQLEAGGAQRVALLLAEALRDRGHQIETWFLYRKRDAFHDQSDVHVLWSHPPRGFEYCRIVHNLTLRLRDFRPDAVLTHTHYANVLAQPIALLAGVTRRVAVQHSPVAANPVFARLADRIIGGLGAYTRNVAVSDSVTSSLVGYPRRYLDRVTRIHNGAPDIIPGGTRITVREKWGLPADVPIIVNVGRLSAPKNQVTLIDAMEMVDAAHLVIVGEGELRDRFERKVLAAGLSQRVHLLGELSWSDTMAIVSAGDVFAFPSISEAMPMSLVEAMQLGCSIVASDIPGVRETVGEAGLLVPPGRSDLFAAAIHSLLSSSELRERMRSAATTRSSLFSLTGMVDAYERTLNA